MADSHWTGKFLGYSSWSQIKDVVPSYGVAAIVAVSVWFLKYLPISNFIILAIQLTVASLMFFVLCEKIKMPEYFEIKGIVLGFIQNYKMRLQGSNTKNNENTIYTFRREVYS